MITPRIISKSGPKNRYPYPADFSFFLGQKTHRPMSEIHILVYSCPKCKKPSKHKEYARHVLQKPSASLRQICCIFKSHYWMVKITQVVFGEVMNGIFVGSDYTLIVGLAGALFDLNVFAVELDCERWYLAQTWIRQILKVESLTLIVKSLHRTKKWALFFFFTNYQSSPSVENIMKIIFLW